MPEMEELFFQMAWKEYDNIQWGIANIENKSSSLIVANGVIIAVILGLSGVIASNLYLISLFPFLISILFSSFAIVLKTSGVVCLSSPYQFFQRSWDIAKQEFNNPIRETVNEIHLFSQKAKKIGDSKLRWYNFSILIFVAGIMFLIGIYLGDWLF